MKLKSYKCPECNKRVRKVFFDVRHGRNTEMRGDAALHKCYRRHIHLIEMKQRSYEDLMFEK